MHVQSWAIIYLRSFLRPGLSPGPFFDIAAEALGVEPRASGTALADSLGGFVVTEVRLPTRCGVARLLKVRHPGRPPAPVENAREYEEAAGAALASTLMHDPLLPTGRVKRDRLILVREPPGPQSQSPPGWGFSISGVGQARLSS
jgi:hypothetical protein